MPYYLCIGKSENKCSCQNKKRLKTKIVKTIKNNNNESKINSNGCNDDDSPLSLSNALHRST